MHTLGRPAAADTDSTGEPGDGARAADARLARHWRGTRRLTAALLALWALASIVPVFWAAELRQRFFGWPLGFWLVSQGVPVLFLALVVGYARAMRRLDADCGVEEP